MAHLEGHLEMENVMEKKINLFGILGIVVLMAVLSMGSVRFHRVPSVSSESAAPALACLPGSFSDNFRSPQKWENRLVPSVDVTVSLGKPAIACLPGEYGNNFRLAHIWNGFYVPSMDVTGVMTKPFMWNSGH
jgi:hypothetical protein